MKLITLLFSACIISCLSSSCQDFKKLNDPDADTKKIEFAQKFADSYFTRLKNGSYYQFQDEAIDILKNQLTEEAQKTIYQQLKGQFGDFQSLKYAETWIQDGNASTQIYRFKSDFDKSNKKIEIRIVLNETGKIAGFWIKPWSDMLK